MRRSLLRPLQLGVVGFALAASPLFAQVPSPKTARYTKDPQAERISTRLLKMEAEAKQKGLSLQASAKARRIATRDGGIKVEILTSEGLTMADLNKFALADTEIGNFYPRYNRLDATVYDLADLHSLASIPGVIRIRPQYRPLTRAGIASSRADTALKADLVRTRTGLTGAGQTVGVLSDSIAHTSLVRDGDTRPPLGAAGQLRGSRPQDSGDLPASVNILRDDCPDDTTDEGAGMAELVHDIAPDAAIAFHTAFYSEAAFADGIRRLRTEAGCSVIVDDVIYLDEPCYQDGPVAQEVAACVAAGVPYYSAAGNSANDALRENYKDVNPAQNATVVPPTGSDLHDWGSGDGFLPIYVPAGESVLVVMQWNQPCQSLTPNGGSQVDLDLYLTATPDPSALASPLEQSEEIQGDTGHPNGDPLEAISYENKTGADQTVYLAINHFKGSKTTIPQNSSTPLEFWLQFYNSSRVVVPSIPNTSSSCGAPTVFGHMAAPGVASVAAIPWWESPSFNPAVGPTAQTDPEYYSSLGGNLSVPFDTAGNFAPQTRFQPLFTSVDGCNTTFFGVPDSSAAAALGMPTGYAGEPDGFPNFFGTSAAAPNAAAVAALLRQANPSLSPAKINEALASTAIDITGERAGAGLDNVTGYGLIDADAAISKVWTGPNLAFAQPDGWSSQLVVSQQKGNFADQTLKAKTGTFVSFSVTNNGGLSISQTFTTKLVVDGKTRRQWKTRGLAAGASFTVTNLSIGKLSAGSHTFQVTTDAGSAVTELNEGDNQVTRSLAVAAKQ